LGKFKNKIKISSTQSDIRFSLSASCNLLSKFFQSTTPLIVTAALNTPLLSQTISRLLDLFSFVQRLWNEFSHRRRSTASCLLVALFQRRQRKVIFGVVRVMEPTSVQAFTATRLDLTQTLWDSTRFSQFFSI